MGELWESCGRAVGELWAAASWSAHLLHESGEVQEDDGDANEDVGDGLRQRRVTRHV